jgi:single-strand DNA-binding protein
LNKVMLIGRLTRDPEVRAFPSGGKVAKFGFAVNNRRRNSGTGEWEDEPVFLDVDAFNRGDFGKLADRVEQYLKKGQQIFIEGHLRLDQWTSQDGQKRSKLTIVCDNFQFLEPRGEYSPPNGGGRTNREAPPAARKPAADGYNEHLPDLDAPGGGGSEADIPF